MLIYPKSISSRDRPCPYFLLLYRENCPTLLLCSCDRNCLYHHLLSYCCSRVNKQCHLNFKLLTNKMDKCKKKCISYTSCTASHLQCCQFYTVTESTCVNQQIGGKKEALYVLLLTCHFILVWSKQE